jgi:hypothetical protein
MAPNLRKLTTNDIAESMTHNILAGQEMIAMCPRGDLNTNSGEISPDRGNHAIRVTRAEPRIQKFR